MTAYDSLREVKGERRKLVETVSELMQTVASRDSSIDSLHDQINHETIASVLVGDECKGN